MRAPRIIVRTIGALVMMTGLMAAAPPASARSAGIETWVANFTDQCTNPSICGKEFLGGEWGHGVFTRDDATGVTTGEIEVAFAFHDVQGAGPLPATSHLKTHVLSWSIGPGAGGGVPNFVFDDYYSTFTGGLGLFFDGPLGGPPVDTQRCWLGCPFPTEIPAVPGHYTLESFVGIDELPGFSYVATVVKIS